MAFKKYKTIGDVAKAYTISISKEDFMLDFPEVKMSETLKADLDYMMRNYPYSISAKRETILFPILKEVWRRYDDVLMLWSNKSISYTKELGGTPDYILAKQSHLGKTVFGKALLAVVEAKKDDFEGGWAQCLLEMYAIQKINGKPEIPVFGIVTNGDNWVFGRLTDTVFIENFSTYSIMQLDPLFSALCCFFGLCRDNAAKF